VSAFLRSIILSLAIALAGCVDDESETSVPEISGTVNYSGLSVPVPAGFETDELNDVLILSESANIRNPREIRVSANFDGSLPSGEISANLNVFYRIFEAGSGSGGTVWTLEAVKTLETDAVLIVATEQSESPDPDFSWVWPIIGGIGHSR
jgi:hypothetical protein